MYCCTPKALYNHVVGSTTGVQHPSGWCDGSHSTTAPVHSPHTSYRWRGEWVIEPIKWMGIIRRPWLTRASGGNFSRTLVRTFKGPSTTLLLQSLLNRNKIRETPVTQCQPEDTHREFQTQQQKWIITPKSSLSRKREKVNWSHHKRSVQRYGRLREWLWTPSSLHS